MKTKKLIIIILLICSVILISFALFFNIPRLSYKYIKETDSYEVSKFYGNLDEIVIPETHNNKKVTSIGVRAFENSKSKKITINGNNLEIIKRRAFYNSKIEEIKLPGSINIIEENAFSYSMNLEKVIIPSDSNLEAISGSVFFMCKNLKEISSIKNVKSIGTFAFYGCENLKELSVSNTKIYSKAFEKCKLKLYITSGTNLVYDYDYNAEITLIIY